jgi:hypothetical protein
MESIGDTLRDGPRADVLTPVGARQSPFWADRFLIRSLIGCGKR